MRILKIAATGFPMFVEPLEIDFYAQQKVPQEKNEMLSLAFSNIYTNNVLSIVGINASGKTTTLKAISFVLQMMKNTPINSIECKDVLSGLSKEDSVCVETTFSDNDGGLYKLQTFIKINTDSLEHTHQYFISEETLWMKSTKSVRSKKDLFLFNEKNIISRRQEDLYLLDDVSIIIGFNRKRKTQILMFDSIDWTNKNGIRVIGEFPTELVKFLDPNIEYLNCNVLPNKEIEFTLKYIKKDEMYLKSPSELNKYLSSGTIKGINLFLAAIFTLKNGGYLIIDELENHFNIEIVSTLIRFFMDQSVNKYGATILFSTHYLEIIDILERNDSVYVVRNMGGINVTNLHHILDRNDVKKSEWFQSGYLEHTTPPYQSYIDLKRSIIKLSSKNEE